ncbi:MAG: hypothetical protein L3J01_06315, partial [Thiomicrorhabdus sp.]|nr:hypothetical protein [Thiomicrorhabdus sp.]
MSHHGSENNKDSGGLTTSKQSGFVILMGLLVLILGAALWFGSTGNLGSEKMKTVQQKSYMADLERVKERMLTYAILNPELFDESTDVPLYIDNNIPGPGYFPCPDVDGDSDSDTGNNCSVSGNLYAMGWVPQKVVARNFSFLPSEQEIENKRYWFAADARFLVDGQYAYSPSQRFAPLNINTPSLVDPTGTSYCDETPASAIPADCVAPLSLDGNDDIVMVLFYAGEPNPGVQNRTLHSVAPFLASSEMSQYLEQPSMVIPANSVNHTQTGVFTSQDSGSGFFNDYVIAITREEWNAAVLSRVARDEEGDGSGNPDGVPDLCVLVDPDITLNEKNSWFNKCRYSGNTPPYAFNGKGCDDLATLNQSVFLDEQGVSNTMWAGWFNELDGLSVRWESWFGLDQILNV